MVVEKIPSICFSSEFGDIVISGVTTSLVAQFLLSGTEVLKETYYPDASGIITIRDIGKVVDAYYNLEDITLSDSYYSTVLALSCVFTSGTNSITKNCTVYHCTAENGLDLNSDDKYLFLTRYSQKKTAADRKEFLSYYLNGQSIYLGIAYVYEGLAKYSNLIWKTPSTDSTKLRSIDVSLSTVSSTLNARMGLSIPVESIIYYDVIAKVNDLHKSRIRFIQDKRNFPQKKNMVYRNCFGSPETFACTGLDERSIELNGEYGYVSGNYRKISTEPVVSDKVNTGYMNAAAASSLEDLILSDKIFIYDNLLADEIVITDIEMVNKSPSNQPISYTLTYRPAKQNHLKFKPGGSVKQRIFDSSFDYTFD